MNEKKSADYKKLVEDMQKKYPVYGSNFVSKVYGKGIASEEIKKITTDFRGNFINIEDFYKTLESWGIDWQKNDEPKTNLMWAINALRNAITDGFEFKKVIEKNFNSPVALWAPVVNKEHICQEINLYTYWQGFGYAEKTPKIKYLLVAQDWGNLFRRKPEDNQGFLKMNETSEWIAPYSEIPKGSGTDTNLFKLFEILGYDLLKLNDDLFFTNFCLGYRSGNETGGMTKEILMNDSAEFKRLCEILEPENILCLGQITFESVFETLTGNKIKYANGYNDFVDKNPFFPANCGKTASKIFPLAHCGVMGTFNRELEQQIEDWKRVLKFSEQVTKIEKPPKTKTALYGAILGDIIGSPYEFDGDVDGVKKTKDFIFFKGDAGFTDDTVMTIAIAEALLDVGRNADEETVCSAAVIKSMRKWGKKYPYAGYGSGFRRWLETDNPKPYNSFGNGSAMRVSAAGWLYDSMFDTREVARWTAQVSHNHLEGIKGAIAVASAIFLARKGSSKDDIKNYIEYEFNYDLSRSLDEIRPTYRHDGSCQGTVPEAIIAFLESTDFEDAIRNAVSLGGDADTLTCITGSIAEAFYGVPQNLIEKCREYLPKKFLNIVDKFNSCKSYILDDLENYSLENKIAEYNKNPSERNLQIVHEEIFNMLAKNHKCDNKLIGFFTLGDMKIDDNGREGYYPDYFNKNGFDYEVFYTNTAEMLKYTKFGEYSEVGIVEVKEVFRIFDEVYNCKDYGLAINPYGENSFFLDNEDLKKILDRFNSETFGEKN